jgi:hypothetical protein
MMIISGAVHPDESPSECSSAHENALDGHLLDEVYCASNLHSIIP